MTAKRRAAALLACVVVVTHGGACSRLFGHAPAVALHGAPPLVATVYTAARERSSGSSRRLLRDAGALIEAGADVDARGPFQRTALHWVVIGAIDAHDARRDRAYRHLAAQLLDAGADVNAEDAYGNTPLDWGEGEPSEDLLDLLIAAGARHGASRHLDSAFDEMLYRVYQALDRDDLGTVRAIVSSDIRPGTVVSLRLLTPLSSRDARPGDPIEAVVVAPVVSGDRTVLPPGTPVEGTVLYAKPIWTQYDQAELVLDFANFVHENGAKTRIVGTVTDVDNAREVVRDNRIVGIPFATHKTVLDWGVRMLGILPFVGFATDTALHGFASTINREIAYAPGIEMKLRVRLPIRLTAAVPDLTWPELSPSPALAGLVRTVPLQALTAGGRPSDVTNVAVLGTRDAVLAAFTAAGWTDAEALGVTSGAKTFFATLWETDYERGPFAPLFLDGRRQDLELQKQANTYAKRHHVRLWQWGTVAGVPAWVGTGTHDIGLRIRRAGTDWPHVIDPRVDRERAKVLADVMFTGQATGYALVPRADATGGHNYEDEDILYTDGRMLVLELREPGASTSRSAAERGPQTLHVQ